MVAAQLILPTRTSLTINLVWRILPAEARFNYKA